MESVIHFCNDVPFFQYKKRHSVTFYYPYRAEIVSLFSHSDMTSVAKCHIVLLKNIWYACVRHQVCNSELLQPSQGAKELSCSLHNASVLSCDLSLLHIIHDYTADMLAHANNFSLEALSATSYFII